MKLTKKLRDECEERLRRLSGIYRSPSDVESVLSLADALAACEVEEEPVPSLWWSDVFNALYAEGWRSARELDSKTSGVLVKGGMAITLYYSRGQITKTRHCPPELLDGRLKALEEQA